MQWYLATLILPEVTFACTQARGALPCATGELDGPGTQASDEEFAAASYHRNVSGHEVYRLGLVIIHNGLFYTGQGTKDKCCFFM